MAAGFRMIGPGVVAAGVGLGTQYFLNLEIERYTLATGETALTGFRRYWRIVVLLLVVSAVVGGFMGPGLMGRVGVRFRCSSPPPCSRWGSAR